MITRTAAYVERRGSGLGVFTWCKQELWEVDLEVARMMKERAGGWVRPRSDPLSAGLREKAKRHICWSSAVRALTTSGLLWRSLSFLVCKCGQIHAPNLLSRKKQTQTHSRKSNIVQVWCQDPLETDWSQWPSSESQRISLIALFSLL